MKFSAALLCLFSFVLGACSPGGKTTLTYPDGMRKAEGYMNENGKDGLWTEWHENGQNKRKGEYKDGKEEGHFTKWSENGEKQQQGEYIDGKREGPWTYWSLSGPKKETEYKDGEIVHMRWTDS
jgi:antitoxin component YwqK of YwqJK toxin-antitoxin module